MNMSPKVSVIVPVYNGANFIESTLQMLSQSSLRDIEIIVVDDGSQDNSFEICSRVAETDSRVKVYKKQNEGVYSARNYGMQVASGRYICFCDQDDIIDGNAYEKMYNNAILNGCDVVMSSTGKFVKGEKVPYEILPDAVLSNEEICEKCLLPILFNGTTIYWLENGIRLENDIWKCMIAREFISHNQISFRRYVNFEDDFIFLLDVLARANKVGLLSDILYYWRINLKSETYNRRYIESLYLKDIVLQREIIQIMEIANVNTRLIERYELHQNCNRYVHMVENECNHTNVRLFERIENLKIILGENQYLVSLGIRKTYKKNLIHRKILLALLEKHCFYGAYFFHKLYVFIRRKGLNFEFWPKLENYLYRKK